MSLRLNELESKRYTAFFLGLIIILGLVLRFYYFPYDVPFSLDSLSYFSYAFEISQTGKFPIDFALINNGWPTFLSIFFSLFKFENFIDYMELERGVSIVISVITGIPVYYLCRNFFSRVYSLGGALLFILEPRVIFNSILGITEPLFVLLATLSLVLFFSGKKMIYCSFGAIALLSLVRFEGLLFIIPISVMYFIKFRKDEKKILKFLLCLFIFVLILTPMVLIRLDTMGTDGFVSNYFTRINDINTHIIQGIPSDNPELTLMDRKFLQQGLPEFLITAFSGIFFSLGLIQFPIYMLFLPFGIFFILRNGKFRNKNYKHITLILLFIFALLPMIYAHGRYIMDVRYYLILYPIIILICIYGIQQIQQKLGNNLVPILIVGVVVIISISYLAYDKPNYEFEREAFEITSHAVSISNVINGESLHGSYITTAGVVEDWPDLKRPKDVKISKISPYEFGSLDEFIMGTKENGLDHIVVDSMNNGPQYIQEIFYNEKDYPYLKKVYDSKIHAYNYHVKIFKIDFKIFNGSIEND